MTDCSGCVYYLGGGLCRLNLEKECGDGGYELYETNDLMALMEGVIVAI